MMSKGSSATRGGQGIFKLLTLISLLSPLLFFVAVFGTRLGLWGLPVGFELLTMKVAPLLAWAGFAAALIALGLSVRRFKAVWPYVVTSVVVSAATISLFQVLGARYDRPGGSDVTTNVADPVAFSRAISAQRRNLTAPSEACDGLTSVGRQVAPETASAAMRQAGFTPIGTAPFRADGYRESFWFGQVHHVAIRIRPGQTDVRVAALYPVKAGDEACRLARDVVAALQPQ
jgi:hypothetical protein